MPTLVERIKRWYEGEFVVYENDPASDMMIIGGDYQRHWSARLVRSIVEFHRREWKTMASIYLAVVMAVAAVMQLLVTMR